MGRRSGGITGTTSRIMARGSLARRPWSSRRLKAVTIFSRLIAFWRRWADSGRRPSVASIASRSFVSSTSKSIRSIKRAMASAPMPPSK